MTRLAIAVLCAAACVIPRSAVGIDQACRDSAVPAKYRSAVKDFSGTLPIADYLDAVDSCNAPRMGELPAPAAPAAVPESRWLATERETYRRVLAASKADILVVPFQVQGYGLDRIERALMTADLAYAVSRGGQYRVADPFLVARALGEGMRRLDPAAVLQLAQSLGAGRIIYGYVGHDGNHAYTLTLQVAERAPETIGYGMVWQQDWRAIAFSDEETPAFGFHRRLPEILAATPLHLQPSSIAAVERTAFHTDVPPRVLVSSPMSLASAALTLDLLGALTPPTAELARERLMEHALLAGLNGREDGPQARFLQAYALFDLMRRPVALAKLGSNPSAEAAVLRALLDGNLPGAQAAIERVPESLDRLLLQISLRDLEAAYGVKPKTEPAATRPMFGGATKDWASLIELRALGTSPWYEIPPIAVKTILEHDFPEPTRSARSSIPGSRGARGRKLDEVDINLANVRHMRKATKHLADTVWGDAKSLRARPQDLLWLLEGLEEEAINKNLWRKNSLQALPESTMHDLARYEPLLAGHPAIEAAHAEAAIMIAQKGPSDVRDRWLAQAARSAAVAAHWDPGENAVAYRALITMGIPSPQSQFMVDAYGYDYPRRSFWPEWSFASSDPKQRSALALESLAFSSFDITPLSRLPPGEGPGQAAAVGAALGNRFDGNPAKSDSPQAEAADDGEVDVAARLERSIAADPERWESYWSLGLLALQSGGKYPDVSKAFLRYPGFRNHSPDDPVTLSNYAYDAGSLLYWCGEPELARPLYEIAAHLGSSSSAMASRAGLQVLDGDYRGAAETSLERGQHYTSPEAYGDYLSFLHAFGRRDEAWAAFSQVKASFDMPSVWVSALVSHRLDGIDEKTLRDWLTSREILEARHGARSFASYYAILASSTDRMPARDLGSFVEQLDGKPLGRMDADGKTLLVPHPLDPQGLMAVHGSAWRAGKSTLPPDTPVKSDLAYFADAYAALRWGDYAAAVDRFAAMAERYPIEGYPLGYAAYAASKTGDKEALEKYVIATMTDASFDYWLARAFFAAGHKDADAALDALQMAFRRRPSTGYRPILTAYQYAEACEWLYRDSGDPRFKSALLEWLRKHQLIQPTQAWAYAMDYTYEGAGHNRVRALAMTRYLDPGSDRIRGASARAGGAADAWFRDHNPFRATASKPQMTESVSRLVPLSWGTAPLDGRPHEQQPQSTLSGGQTDR